VHGGTVSACFKLLPETEFVPETFAENAWRIPSVVNRIPMVKIVAIAFIFNSSGVNHLVEHAEAYINETRFRNAIYQAGSRKNAFLFVPGTALEERDVHLE
jgi:hypothetical protein